MITERRLYLEVGAKLRDIRRGNGLTQADIANILKLERTSITNIENGKQRVGLYVLYQYCNHFDIPINDILPPVSSPKEGDLPPGAAGVLKKLRSKSSAAVS